MISLSNPNSQTQMTLTQDQYDKLLALYVEQIVDNMDLTDLIRYVSDDIEHNLRESCSTDEELIEEISNYYDGEFVEDLVETAKTSA